ncbi:DUF2339 domain-containing protein [Cupriavidus lacunae]|uniref:DUF2339 domain-containing protein n=1 Tax=Cupriavidus lacunae TaxID=2666307 RepID=A0A370NLJ1_9BURK|nr:DUF2339 domain-containing protein [Cupriavidus lacunae]RDK06451.1 hypothetical protein DN412_31170 [Cupriavidus lacunae]
MTSVDILALILAGGGLYAANHALKRISELERRIKGLEAEAKQLMREGKPTASDAEVGGPVTVLDSLAPEAAKYTSPTEDMRPARPTPPVPVVERPVPTLSVPAEPSAFSQVTNSVANLVKRNPFAFLGVLLVLVSVGFLFSWLAANNVLPPAVRIVLVAMAGLAVFLGTLRFADERSAMASILQGGALAVQYVCVLWAYQGYELVSTATAFTLLGVVSIAAFGWAIWRREGLFAFMGLAGGLLTPVIASAGGSFDGLALYTLGVSLLSLGAALRLDMPSLASASLGGVALLLGSAWTLQSDSSIAAAGGLLSLITVYSATGLYWAAARRARPLPQLASIVGLLTFAPVAMDIFLHQKAGFSRSFCAVTLIPVVVVYLVTWWFARGRQMRTWLLVIAAVLGLVSIGIGLEGATRALALSVSAMALVMLAWSTENIWAERVAFVYWALASLASFITMTEVNRLPLALAGIVALLAGFFAKGSLVRAKAYVVFAPLLLCYASLGDLVHQPVHPTWWFLGWALVSTAIGRQLNWNELRWSALWVVVAGFNLWVSELPKDAPAFLARRELVLVACLAASAYLVSTTLGVVSKTEPKAALLRGPASLLLPVVASVELLRVVRLFSMSLSLQVTAIGLLWAGWAVCACALTKRQGTDYRADEAGIFSGCLLLLSTMVGQFNGVAELLKWLSVAMLLLVARNVGSKWGAAFRAGVYGLSGALLIGTALQLIGLAYQLDKGAIWLLLERAMQPWVSILWAAGGIATVVYATKARNRGLWSAGGTAIVLLIGKMLFLDLSTFSLVSKVLVFLVTGVAFIGLGYLSPRPPEE